MDHLEAWLEFRRGETYRPSEKPKCAHCGRPCSGDVTEEVNGKDRPVCDPGLDGSVGC